MAADESAESAESSGSPRSARQRLLAAARVVLARDGIEGLTLRAIAREAGVSHGAPLRHFPNLSRLLAALAAEGFEQLVASVASALDEPDPTDPLRQVAQAGRGYLRFAVAEPGVFSVMFRPDLCDVTDPGYQSASADSFNQLMDVVAAAQATGWQSDVATARLAAVLWSNVHGLAELWLHGTIQAVVDTPDIESLADTLFALTGTHP